MANVHTTLGLDVKNSPFQRLFNNLAFYHKRCQRQQKSSLDFSQHSPFSYLFDLSIIARVNQVCKHLQNDARVAARFPNIERLAKIAERTARHFVNAWAQPTLVLEMNVARLERRLRGRNSHQRFVDFLQTHLRGRSGSALKVEYQALTTTVEQGLELWSNAYTEMLGRFAANYADLAVQFPCVRESTLEDISWGAGDAHDGHRTVAVLHFANGEKLVYRPRPLATLELFQNVVKWTYATGFRHSFKTFAVVSYSTHGWVEYVNHAPCLNDVQSHAYYDRLGALSCLLFALNAVDMHCENLVAHGEHPMFFDVETVFHPVWHYTSTGVTPLESAINTTLSRSVAATGILPASVVASEASIDVSALSGIGAITTEDVMRWENQFTDEMRLQPSVEFGTTDIHRPHLKDLALNPLTFEEDFIDGFTAMYQHLLQHREDLLRGPLCGAGAIEARVVVRPTSTYFTLIQQALHPDYTRSLAARSALLSQLKNAPVPKGLESLITSEIEALQRNDIPLFVTRLDSHHLWGERTNTEYFFLNVLTETGLSGVEERVRTLSTKELALQTRIIRGAFSTLETNPERNETRRSKTLSSCTPRIPVDPLEAAVHVGDVLLRGSFTGGGRRSWITFHPCDETRWSFRSADLHLYNGLPGIAMFLAYLGHTTGESRFTAAATEATAEINAKLDCLGIADDSFVERCCPTGAFGALEGLGGTIYALSHLGKVLCEDKHLALAARLIQHLRGRATHDRYYGISNGVAGGIMAALSLHSSGIDLGGLELAKECAAHLLKHSILDERGRSWTPQYNSTSLSGLAHGNSGIALALHVLGVATNDTLLIEAACQALRFENTMFVNACGNWADRRDGMISVGGLVPTAVAWAHGATGIGLVRNRIFADNLENWIENDLEYAIRATIEHPLQTDHSLVSGNGGRLGLLQDLSAPQRSQRANDYLRKGIARLTIDTMSEMYHCNTPSGVDTPGLMIGLAGIGYALLRAAQPDAIPSILTFNPPQKGGFTCLAG
jgi:type 2 lantibiotic biosynthesis protein LanM